MNPQSRRFDPDQISLRRLRHVPNNTDTPNSIYRPLSQIESEIRLIELLPSEAPTETIKCEMRHVSLARPPSYFALSYCWGDQSRQSEICVNSEVISVTRNLVSALLQMRDSGFTSLWVDAICINQEDREERSAQVTRMSAIYKEASAVVVWLGPASDGSDKVMKMLHGLEEGKQLPMLYYQPSNVTQKRSQLTTWAELDDFFARSYWSRLWIVQEIAAASRVILVCGGHVVEWERMEYLIERLPLELGSAYAEHSLIQNLYKTRSDRIESRPLSLLECLSRSRASQSTDARDKVFGLLGLAFDRSHFVTEPNYGLSENTLCQAMTESAIISKRSLDLILLSQRNSVLHDLPTWCPDYLHFSSYSFNTTMLKYLDGADSRYRQGIIQPRWNATSNSRATRAVVHFDNGILKCRGWQLGTINGLGRLVEDSSASFPQHNSHLTRDAEAADFTPFDAVCRVLLLYGMRKSFVDLPALLLALWIPTHQLLTRWGPSEDAEYIKQWLEANTTFILRGRKLRDWVVSWRTISEAPRNGYVGLFGLFQVARKARVLFDSTRMKTVATMLREGMRLMTMTDDRVGWAHPSARLGDKVFLLQGCSMPVILRHEVGDERGFHLVGHAYVDRIMDGEFWGGLDQRWLMDVYLC
jgi:Heterokaryon incompatibility protein (HET)